MLKDSKHWKGIVYICFLCFSYFFALKSIKIWLPPLSFCWNSLIRDTNDFQFQLSSELSLPLYCLSLGMWCCWSPPSSAAWPLCFRDTSLTWFSYFSDHLFSVLVRDSSLYAGVPQGLLGPSSFSVLLPGWGLLSRVQLLPIYSF